MPQLGGFFAVTYVAESLFQDGLTALWGEHYDEAGGGVSWTFETGRGRLEADGGYWMDRPNVTFDGAADSLRLRLSGAARLSLRLADNALGGAFIGFSSTIRLRPEIGPIKLKYIEVDALDFQDFSFDAVELQVTWFDGPHQAQADDVVFSAELRKALADETRARAAKFLAFELPTKALYSQETALMTKGVPGAIILTPSIRFDALRILDGWIAVGINSTSGIRTTNGDQAAIGPPPEAPPDVPGGMAQAPPGGENVRIIMDAPATHAYLEANAKLAMKFAEARNPKMHPKTVSVALADDTFSVHITGMHDAPDPFPGVDFTADIGVRAYVGNTFIYAVVKPSIHIDTNWLEEIFIAIKEFFAGGDLFGAIDRANQTERAVIGPSKLLHQHSVPGLSRITISAFANRLNIRPGAGYIGIFGTIKLSEKPYEPNLGDTGPDFWKQASIRDRFLDPTPGATRLRVDPTFLQRIRVTRGSDGSEVASTWGWTIRGNPPPGILGNRVDFWAPENWLETSYTVEMTVERPPGTIAGHEIARVAVADVFDRSRPYVRWRKRLVQADGVEDPPPWTTVLSAVHQTALPGRCKFSDWRSRGHWPSMYRYDTLTELPPADQPDGEFSSRRCPYCFPDADG